VFLLLSSVWCLCRLFGEAKQPCPAGFSCPKVMQRSFATQNDDNEFILIPCPPGTFSALGQDDCIPCEPGYYANTSGLSVCLPCPAGYMCAEAVESPSPCPLGTHSSCTGQTCCSACPLGTYTPRVGSIQCINCPAGVRCPASPNIVCGGDLLSPKHQAILTEFTGRRNLKWKLLYKATRDGFEAADFHRFCNGQAPTMTIIQSQQGYLFGGYTNVAWNSSYNYGNDPHSFIFTLSSPHSILPTRYLITGGKEQYAIFDVPSYGPTFGGGHDIYVPDKSNATDGYTNFPHTYTDTTRKGSVTFSGNYSFRTSDIEVYKLLG
jgi:hypothetical protein